MNTKLTVWCAIVLVSIAVCLTFTVPKASGQYQPCVWPNHCAN